MPTSSHITPCMSCCLQCFSQSKCRKEPRMHREAVQETYEQGTWGSPCPPIVRIVVDHLKLMDSWKLEGRSIRLINRAWCRGVDGLVLEIRPHSSRNAQLDDVVSSSRKFKSLEAMDLVGCSGFCLKEGFRKLEKLSSLSTIKLSGLCITDEAIYHLKYSKSIIRINLLKTLVTNRGLMELGKMSQLKAVELKQLDMITSLGLDYLTQLTELKLIRCPAIADDGLKKVAKYAHLKHLSIVLVGVTDLGVEEVCRMTQLSKLRVLCSNMTGEGFKYISKLVNLQDLCLWEIDDMKIPLSIFCLPQLEKICLNSNGNLNGSELHALGSIPRLSCLQLNGKECVHLDEVLSFTNLVSLKQLRVGQIRNVVGFQLPRLHQLPQLSQLNLQGCRHVGNHSVAQFTSLTNLTELFLHNCDHLTCIGLEQISLMHQLQKLTLGPSIDDACLTLLSGMPRLKHLGFVLCNMISFHGLQVLKSSMSLREVCLDWCGVMLDPPKSDFLYIIEFFLTGLDHIGLHPFRLDEAFLGQVQELAPALKVDCDIQWIWNQ